MKNIPLREYVRDIENLIAKGKPAYAEKHCKHLLHSFPKHVELYRLLGNACLDLEKIEEAGDVFNRLLSVVPDDFSALIGLGVIKEDQNDLDSAIWYLEKAAEVDTSNGEVQSEIRRLFQKRDGISPDRLCTSSGGLIRMYLKSNLFDQAIIKARSVLSDDPQQIDTQLLLARTYYHLGKKMEAAELCIQVINVLPYCLEANKILFIICSSMNRASEAGIFQQRINEIDPYSAFISRKFPSAGQVPDDAIMVEQLDVPLKEQDLYFRQSEEPAAELMKILYAPSNIAAEASPPVQDFSAILDEGNQSAEIREDFQSSPAETESAAECEQTAQADNDVDLLQKTNPDETSAVQKESLYREEDLPDWLKQFSKPAQVDLEGIHTAKSEPAAIEDQPAKFTAVSTPEQNLKTDAAVSPAAAPINEQEQVLAWLKNLEESEQVEADPILMNEFPSLNFGPMETPSDTVPHDIDTPVEFSSYSPPPIDDAFDLQAQLRSILMQDSGESNQPGKDDPQGEFSLTHDLNLPIDDFPQDTSVNPDDTIDRIIG